ncbi:MAG: YfhO family protein, partial [Gordonibacter sp.]|uniref:YfhO family protein n=1 Tax=Gordonibacter sp. TaxID=1968902 RepID=UPI002FC5B23E
MDVVAMKTPNHDILSRFNRFIDGRRSFFWVYTVVFILVFFLACMPLWLNGKSLIREVDGLSMLYTNFVWIGRWIREVFSNIFITHTFEIPMWTTDLGYGSDILSVLGSGIINPFYWISACIPERFAEYAFQFVIVLRAWLAGLAFAAYARYHGNGRFLTFIGALAYVFAGSTVIIFSQPGFIETMILFPLFLLSADRIFDGKNPLPFIGMCAFIFASSYYTGYMMCLFLLGYCLLRYFVVEKRRSLKELGKLFLKFLGYLVVGVVVAAIFFLP